MDIQKFRDALTTLMTSWGSDAPPEAVWAANEFMNVYYDSRGVPKESRIYFQEDSNSDYEEVLNKVQ